MFKTNLFLKQSAYFKLSDLDLEEEFILVWCANDVLIHEKKPTLRKRIIKKILRKKRSLVRKLRNFFIKKTKYEEEIHTDDMDFCCRG